MIFQVLGSGSNGNCYLLKDSNNKILILECGVNIKMLKKALNYDFSNVVGCLVTHEHKDHSKYVNDLIMMGIDVYMTQGTVEALQIADSYRLHIIKSEKMFILGSIKILPFEVKHDAKEPVGFLIYHNECGKILFATDTYYIEYKFKELNHILCECNYGEKKLLDNLKFDRISKYLYLRIMKSHFSFENFKDFLNENDLKEVNTIVLLHSSELNSDIEFKGEIEELTGITTYIAKPNLQIELKSR